MKLLVEETGTHEIARLEIPHSRCIEIQINHRAGARYESTEENGIAHFTEHIVFKGSNRYPSYQAIRDRASELGAYLNAHTSHEGITFKISTRKELASEAVELISEIAQNPLIRSEDVELEKGVITQELQGSLDNQQRRLHYALAERYYRDHPLSRKILGEAQTISGITAERLRDYSDRTLVRPMITLVGNLDHVDESLLREGAFRGGRRPESRPPSRIGGTSLEVVREDSNQTHLKIAYPLAKHPASLRERSSLASWNDALSRELFSEIREKRGLCYSIGSGIAFYHDRDRLVVSAGLESSKAPEAYKVICDLVSRFRSDGIPESDYQKIIAKRVGDKIRAYESTSTLAAIISGGWSELNEFIDPEQTLDLLDEIERDEVNESAQMISGDHLAVALGPHSAEEFDLD